MENVATPLYHKFSMEFLAHVNFPCIGWTVSYPHKEFLIPRPHKFVPVPANEGTGSQGMFFFWASCSNHCLAALDLGAGVEQPLDSLIVHNRQGIQSMGRSIDWRLEDNMVNGLFFCVTITEAMPHLNKQERKRPSPVRRRLSRTQAREQPGLWDRGAKGTLFPVAVCPGSQKDECSHTTFFCNQAENACSLSPIAALVATTSVLTKIDLDKPEIAEMVLKCCLKFAKAFCCFDTFSIVDFFICVIIFLESCVVHTKGWN